MNSDMLQVCFALKDKCSNLFYGYVESPCVQCVLVDLLVGDGWEVISGV